MINDQAVVNDADFLGIQRQTGAAGFYTELLEAVAIDRLGKPSGVLAQVGDPSRSLALQEELFDSTLNSQNVVIGGGLTGPYEKIPNLPNRSYLGVRGFLTLNRLPNEVESKVVVGELALLSADLNIPAASSSPILYVSCESDLSNESTGEALDKVDAEFVSLDDGLDRVIGKIQSASVVISDGVIGLSIADAFGIPNVWHDAASSSVDEFQVMDYLLGVGRPTHLKLLEIPIERRAIERKTRTANPRVIEDSRERIITALSEAAKYAPTELIDAPLMLNGEPAAMSFGSGNSKKGRLEFNYAYDGEKERRQAIVSFELAKIDGTEITSIEEIPKLLKSQREEIGFFRYLSFEKGEGTKVLAYDLPEGICCTGIRLIKWSDSSSQIRFENVIHRMLK